MSDILKEIYATKRKHVAECKKRIPLSELESQASAMPPTRGFIQAVNRAQTQGAFALIAEIKKASPSKGIIRQDFNPAQLAVAYETGGATCLSVLTDSPYFQGAPTDLKQAHGASRLPLLRKDFMCDPYQVVEARLLGADCILIILAMLDITLALELEKISHSMGLDVLIEVHNEEEMLQTHQFESPLIGINNRDLKTFEVTIETSTRLAQLAPKNRILVSESGITDHSDIVYLSRQGISCFLVGESLMREVNISQATHRLLTGT